MEDYKTLDGFRYWRIPSGEGVVYFEGIPTEEERAANIIRTLEERKLWQPDEEAMVVYGQLKTLEGQQVTIQLWNHLMLWLEDEGALPFSCDLIKVYTRNIKQEREDQRDFLQLFIDFKNPKVIKNGNLGGSPLTESNMNKKADLYTLDCSKIAWLTALELDA